MEDKFKITLRTYEVTDLPLVGKAGHNEIVFSVGDKDLVALNGDAYNRESGNLVFFSTSPDGTLRVRGGPSLKDYATDEFPLVKETTVFEGSKEEMIAMMAKAIEAAEFINKQNIDYLIVGAPVGSGVHFDAQNSNSVANTLLGAMGINNPSGQFDIWLPGKDRVLLASDYKFKTESMTHEERVQFIQSRLENFSEENVGAQIRKEQEPGYVPENNRVPTQIYFDPSAPSMKP